MKTNVWKVAGTLAALATAGLASAAGSIPGQGTWETTLLPRYYNSDDVPDAFYDTTRNVTWLRQGCTNPTPQSVGQLGNCLLYSTDGGVQGWDMPTFDDYYHLWHVTLGNERSDYQAGPPVVSALTNIGPFDGQYAFRDFGIPYASRETWAGGQPVAFDMRTGLVTPASFNNLHVISMHQGDVSSVPELPTSVLLAMGMMAVIRRATSRRLSIRSERNR